ncbi:MAG: hypothetical protein K9J79_09320 [Desulfobacteraceae bacterium]|nr:hypothetical protein [Desulfobacteraceae bacterium]MCF8095542.1 hypothetical protein [Desulfobacteraceae bacterium]
MRRRAEINAPTLLILFLILGLAGVTGCGRSGDKSISLDVPRGYVAALELNLDGRRVGFGPFVGYYFKPESPDDLTRLKFVCFNERSFYTRDMPENAKLFEGEAVLTRLADVGRDLPDRDRINPVFFPDSPEEWLKTRPSPQDEFIHFHSCYDAQGPVLVGFWVRHVGTAAFTYDMGGRVDPGSPLYHRVEPGVDKDFARIMEFDRGLRAKR